MIYKSLFLLLSLVSLSLTYRDGARNDSCYGHEIVHLSISQPVPKLDCAGPCPYDLELVARVNESTLQQIELINYTTTIQCGSVYEKTILENAANEFIIGFTVNFNLSIISPSLLLFVTTPETNPVTFTVTANGFNFTGTAFNDSSTEVSIPSTFQVESDSERNKGIYVKAEEESKVVVYGLSHRSGSSDTFLALPCSNLAVEEYEYYAMTYPDTKPKFTSDVLIVGCEDNTLVTTPSNTITLNKLETYLIQSSDSTGMRITSTKPVSFFSNQQCTDIPTNITGCDHLTEQLPPTSTWGTSFYAASLLGRNTGELFRIIAAENSTTVRVNCTTFSQAQVYNLSVAGNWQEFEIRPLSFCNIESSAPILVTQFALGRGLDGMGDPFMMMIPPVEQYSNNYVLKAPSSFSTNYITIYVATKYYQPNRIFVDDTSQVSSSWTSVYCSNSLLCGYITRVNLTAGEHRVYHHNPHARIGVSAYGFNITNSYGYPGGLKLQSTGLNTNYNPLSSSTCNITCDITPANTEDMGPTPDTGNTNMENSQPNISGRDGDGLLIALIVVIVVALVVISVMGLVIILLVLFILRMQRTMKTSNKELVELRTHNIADTDQSDIYEEIERDGRRDEVFSEIKSPSTTDTTNTQDNVEGLALTQCPAYLPVNSPSAARCGEDVEDKMNDDYEN